MFFMGPGKRISRRKHLALVKEFVPPAPIVVPPPDYSDLHRLLILTRTRLSRGWTRGMLAENAQGDYVVWNSPTAVRFCTIGGLHRSLVEMPAGYGSEQLVVEARELLYASLPKPTTSDLFSALLFPENIEQWNDQHQNSLGVLRHFDYVIAKLEKERLAQHTDVYSGC